MPAFDRNVEVTFGKLGTSVTKPKLSGHKWRCSVGTSYCAKCPIFCTKSGDDLIYHIAEKHSAAGLKNNHTCKESSIEFPRFHCLRHNKQRYHTHTAETNSNGEKAEIQSLADARVSKSLEGKLQSWRHFLVESEIQRGRHSLFNFVVNNLTAQVMEEKFDRLLDKTKVCSEA